MSSTLVVRGVNVSDRPAWERLYGGYGEFYGTGQTAAQRATVWAWLADPGHTVEGLVAEDSDRGLVGLAHYRPFSRPLSATTGCYLDDLFVDPDARGRGVAVALLEALAQLATDRGWSVVRWMTAEDNLKARRMYDRLASRTGWVTYDLDPSAPRP